jgi:hypothetical protein
MRTLALKNLPEDFPDSEPTDECYARSFLDRQYPTKNDVVVLAIPWWSLFRGSVVPAIPWWQIPGGGCSVVGVIPWFGGAGNSVVAVLVSRIEDKAFQFTRLAAICLPASLEALGDGCFESLRLRSVFFEPGCKLTRIGSGTFRACESLRSIRIPSSVEALGPHCFAACSCLRFVTFESSSKISCIPAGLFDLCFSLSSVEFGEGSRISCIECRAFAMCLSLKFLSIPASLVDLSARATDGSHVSEISIESGNRSFRANGNLVVTKPDHEPEYLRAAKFSGDDKRISRFSIAIRLQAIRERRRQAKRWRTT